MPGIYTELIPEGFRRLQPMETPAQQIAREITESRERRLDEHCRQGHHALGPIQTPNALRPTYVRWCCICEQEFVVTGSEFGTVVPGTTMRFPARLFGTMSSRQIRRMLGLPRGTTFLHNFRDGSTWVVVPPEGEPEPEEEESEDER